MKRTSLWNKACDELKRHQEFLSKVKNIPDFTKEPFGNPFETDELRSLVSVVSFDTGTSADDVDDDKANFDEVESEEVLRPVAFAAKFLQPYLKVVAK